MIRKLLLITSLLVLALSAQQSGFNIPAGAFAQPSEFDLSNNPSYWAGYVRAEPIAGAILPSPTKYATYELYKVAFSALYKPQFAQNVLNGNVGYDNALEDAANYLWLFYPGSCHLVQCQ